MRGVRRRRERIGGARHTPRSQPGRVDRRRRAGSHVGRTYTPPVGEGLWQPSPPNFGSAVEPYWSEVRPMVLPRPPTRWYRSPTCRSPRARARRSGSRPTPPTRPVWPSPEAQRETAMFWRDNPHSSGLPSGHWMQITRQACQQRGSVDGLGRGLRPDRDRPARRLPQLLDLEVPVQPHPPRRLRPHVHRSDLADLGRHPAVPRVHVRALGGLGGGGDRAHRSASASSPSPTPTPSPTGAPARSTPSAPPPRRRRSPGSTAASTTRWPSSSGWTRATPSGRWWSIGSRPVDENNHQPAG